MSNKYRVMTLDFMLKFVSGLFLEHLLTNFLQTCIMIDHNRKEWFGIVAGQISSSKYRVMALEMSKFLFRSLS